MKSKKNTTIFVIALLLFSCLCDSCSVSTPVTTNPTSLSATVTLSQPTTVETTVVESTKLAVPTLSPTSTEVIEQTVQPTSIALSSPTVEASQVVQPGTSTSDGFYQVHFVDLGQGDSELILTPNKKVVLIDGGEQGTGIVSYLQSFGVTQIDVIVNTHPHSDHFGGLVDIFKSDIPVKKVITNGRASNTELFNQFLDGIANTKAEYVEAQRGDKFTIDGMEFDVVSPTKDYTSDDVNNTSLVIWMKYNGVSFLFTGDQAFDAENNLLASGQNLKADFLKVGHNGSATSTSEAFLQAVSAKVAVYSAGVNNQYHLPSPDTIARLSASVSAVYGTDKDGTVVVTVNPDGYKITFGKSDGRGPPAVVVPTAVQPVQQVVPTDVQPAPVGQNLFLTIASVTSPIARGGSATLIAQTIPGANCTIKVNYKSGASKASGLAAQTADSSGQVSWTWKVASNTTPGTWRIVVTASDGKTTITQEGNFTVQK
jgi:beta-lactamase superfamily II metal-dependent hydrolase